MRLIDADSLDITTITTDDYSGNEIWDVVMKEDIDDAPTVEAIPKADYEARLKADLEAILVDLKLEIEEREQYYIDKFLEPSNAVHDAAMCGRMFGCGDCKEIIQQKIDRLKGIQRYANNERLGIYFIGIYHLQWFYMVAWF